ncbi:hypothetical protein ABFT23_14740 [Nocardioides sp. C4-1]|uniref:hypothetical protein n=1 Tax=Nocardioides sp. C4-1 TaxID=3151851 RepID=UPI0032634AAE
MRPLLVLVPAVVLALSGCGGSDEPDDATGASTAPIAEREAALPPCSETWAVGEVLPDPYRGCDDDGDTVQPTFVDCEPGQAGDRYVEFDGGVAYAVEGGPVVNSGDAPAELCAEATP